MTRGLGGHTPSNKTRQLPSLSPRLPILRPRLAPVPGPTLSAGWVGQRVRELKADRAGSGKGKGDAREAPGVMRREESWVTRRSETERDQAPYPSLLLTNPSKHRRPAKPAQLLDTALRAAPTRPRPLSPSFRRTLGPPLEVAGRRDRRSDAPQRCSRAARAGRPAWRARRVTRTGDPRGAPSGC